MNLYTQLFQSHPSQIFTAAALPLAAFALHPNASSVVPFIFFLSLLLLYSPILFRKDNQSHYASLVRSFWLWTSLTVGGALPVISPSLNALSAAGQSMFAVFLASGLMSSLALALLYVHVRIFSRFRTPWSQLTLFPTLWTSLCFTLPYINPVGYLGVWLAPYQRDPYSWLLQYVGPMARTWIIAAWASLISHVVATSYMGSGSDANHSEPRSLIDYDHEYDDEGDIVPPTYSGPSSTVVLSVLLIGLAVPSLFFTPLPLPVVSTESTTLGVGCVLPLYPKYRHHNPTLEDYLKETAKLQNSAKLLLWPEGAVAFASETDRMNAFETIQRRLQGDVYVGVSFEETFLDPSDHTGWTGVKRTGIALLSNSTASPHFVYYKRHLVPIAESFSLRHSSVPPEMFSIGKSHSLPITASICLDFAHPSPFATLDSRPSLILGPAKTWDRTIGLMMWNQAVQRAKELDTTILWCDGGKGGVSGIAGSGHEEVLQVGLGSWTREIGVEYPFRNQRSLYAKIGDTVMLLFWAGVLVVDRLVLLNIALHHISGPLVSVARHLVALLRRPQRGNGQQPPNLLDA